MREEKKYDIDKYAHESVQGALMISTAVGFGSLVIGAITRNLETLVAGGSLFIGSPIIFFGDQFYSYMKNHIDYMNEQDKKKDKEGWREK